MSILHGVPGMTVTARKCDIVGIFLRKSSGAIEQNLHKTPFDLTLSYLETLEREILRISPKCFPTSSDAPGTRVRMAADGRYMWHSR